MKAEQERRKTIIKEKSIWKEILDWIVCFFVAFVAAVVIRYFLFTPTLVSQTSMTPTILNGERVLINRLVRTFQMPLYRGDIVTFERPDYTNEDGTAGYYSVNGPIDFIRHNVLELSKISYIKRVIGIAGDTVQIKRGNVYINGQKQSEIYLHGIETPVTGDFDNITVPEGYIFVMGDNRSGSSDSREFGCIPLEKVEGRVTYRLWPFDKFGKIDK